MKFAFENDIARAPRDPSIREERMLDRSRWVQSPRWMDSYTTRDAGVAGISGKRGWRAATTLCH